MIVPEMGTIDKARAKNGLAAALFSPVQQRVLGLLFGQPERTFRSGELIRAVGSGTGAAHRQLQRLAGVGLVTVTRIGNQKHYQANPASPVYPEIHGLIVKTVGLVDPLRAALAPVAKDIEVAFVFGSIAKGTDRAQSDVDLLVVSDRLGYAEIYKRLQTAEKVLARTINPTVLTRAEWRKARSAKDSFATRIGNQPRIFVIGDQSAAA
jgi:predicted nucleotidyltransferase